MVTPEIIEGTRTQFINVPFKIEHVSLTGQTSTWMQTCYPCIEFQKEYWSMLLNNRNELTKKTVGIEELPTYFDKNLKLIKESLENELKLKESLYKAHREVVSDTFDRIANFIAELNFDSGTVELTNSKNIKFTLLFRQDMLLMISKSLFPKDFDFNSNEIIFSLFINRKLIASDVSEISLFTKGFTKYLAM